MSRVDNTAMCTHQFLRKAHSILNAAGNQNAILVTILIEGVWDADGVVMSRDEFMDVVES
jgi:hypothetical protein